MQSENKLVFSMNLEVLLNLISLGFQVDKS